MIFGATRTLPDNVLRAMDWAARAVADARFVAFTVRDCKGAQLALQHAWSLVLSLRRERVAAGLAPLDNTVMLMVRGLVQVERRCPAPDNLL